MGGGSQEYRRDPVSSVFAGRSVDDSGAGRDASPMAGRRLQAVSRSREGAGAISATRTPVPQRGSRRRGKDAPSTSPPGLARKHGDKRAPADCAPPRGEDGLVVECVDDPLRLLGKREARNDGVGEGHRPIDPSFR